MAAQDAVANAISSNPGAKLRAAQTAARKKKQASPGFLSNLPGLRAARGAMLGASMMSAVPRFDTQPLPSFSQTDTEDSVEAEVGMSSSYPSSVANNRAFQQTDRQRRLQRQIGQQVGLNLNVGSVQNTDASVDLSAELLQQEYAAREADLLLANQLGLDDRSANAKRSELESVGQEGVQAFQQLTDKVSKEIGAATVALASDAAEAIDSAFEDGGLTQGVVFIRNTVSGVRTILDPEKPENPNPRSIREINAKATRMAIDVIFPRFNLFTISGISGLVGFLAQWLLIGLGVFIILLSIAIPVYVSNYAIDTFGLTGFNIFKTVFSYVTSSDDSSTTTSP